MTTDCPGCWHCGQPLAAGVSIHATVAGHSRSMCCPGCRAAAEWIEQLGLADYYRLRTTPAEKPMISAAEDAPDPWQRPNVARHVVRELDPGLHEALLLIEGIRCTACVWLLERALGATAGVVSVQVNALSRRARVTWRGAALSLPQLLQVIARTGYRALPLDARSLDDARRRELRAALKRLLVAGFGAMQAMMFASAIYLGAAESLDASTRDLLRWLGLLVATPVVFYSAWPFFAGALRSLRARSPGMDVPVALAIAVVYAASLLQAVRGSGEVYFDSISMFVFFLLGGRYLEIRARHQAGDLTDALARLAPAFADRRLADGTLQRVGIHELCVGDQVHVAAGGILPADGILLSERCRVDEALISGESAPRPKRRADRLIAGSVLEDGPIQMRVDRVGANTTLASITVLVERAQAQRPQLVRAGDRAAVYLVWRVLALTSLTVAAWTIFDPSRAFAAAVAVLVISCPCAFALAVPTAVARAIAALARRGVLVAKPDALQALAGCTHVMFDKTGTLTEAALAPADVKTFRDVSADAAWRLAAALARQSRHPVARVIAAAWPDPEAVDVCDAANYTGLGVSGNIAGQNLRLGRGDFATAGQEIPSGFDEAVLLADDAGPIAAFSLSERLRADARAAVAALREQGLTILIASGDAHTRVANVAAQLKPQEFRSRQSPAGKLAWLNQLRAGGARVLAVGDGVNDAPVLAGADVAMALSDGAELAQASSDIVLTGGHLGAIAPARAIAQQTLRIVRQNQRWALFYNFTAVPLAAMGLVPPWLAAIGMSASSLAVMLNALRIGRGSVVSRSTAHRLAPRQVTGARLEAT